MIKWTFLFFLNSILFGAGLSMDAFSVSVTEGLQTPDMTRRQRTLIAGTFALFQTLNQFHRGVGDTKFSLVASIFMIMVRIPMTYVLVHIVQLGEISVWMGMVSGWMASLLINTLRFLSGKWRGKAYVQLENAEE